MSITGAIVLFAVIWFLVLFVVLPLRLTTQGEAGKIVPGTPAGAPDNLAMRAKLRLATLFAVVIWAILAGIIMSGVISVRDFDWMGRIPPAPDGTGG
jgi:predicted secreted protein